MITKIEFNMSTNNIKKGFVINDVKPLTLLVGNNGTGKSTILNAFKQDFIDKYEKNKRLKLTHSFKAGVKVAFYDFEKDNPRTKSDSNDMTNLVFGISSFFKSHGETNLAVLNSFNVIKEPTLILLDEPDMGLSIQSIFILNSIIENLLKQGCQVIMSCHNPLIMTEFKEVYSIEDKKWFDSIEYINKCKKKGR